MTKNRLIRFLYNHNPSYLISGCLVLFGVQTTLVGDHQTETNFVYLGAILLSFTVLLAVTSYLIVRFGKVWEDARSIFIVLVLLFFAISSSFDGLCLDNFALASGALAGGFLFAIVVTEAILWGLKIKFPCGFRVPYYLILSLCFLFPLLLSAHEFYFQDFEARWLLLLFPMLAAIAMLSLLPAVQSGPAYVSKNGTPWNWPLYPWCLFAMLFLGLAGKTMLLCWSFDPSGGEASIFGPYLIVPIFLAAMILLLEIGKQEQSTTIQLLGLVLSLMAIPVSLLTWHTGEGGLKFLEDLVSEAGSPVWFTLMMLIAIYSVAWLRGIASSTKLLTIALLLAIFVVPDSNSISMEQLAAWPVIALAGFHLVVGWNQNSSRRYFFAAVLFAAGVSLKGLQLGWEWYSVAIGLHLLLLCTLIIGVACHDKFASQLNVFNAAMIVTLCLLATVGTSLGLIDMNSAAVEIVLLTLVASYAGNAKRDLLLAYAAVVSMLVGIAHSSHFIMNGLDSKQHKILAVICFVAAACFVIGAFISMLKAGMSQGIVNQYSRLTRDVKSRFVLLEKPIKNH